MSLFEDSTQYEAKAQQAKPMRSRAYSVYDDQTQPETGRGSVSLYPSDTVQGSSRRTSHFPRVPDVAFSQQQQQQQGQRSQVGSPVHPQQRPAQSHQKKQNQLDPRPLNLLALDASFYAQPQQVSNGPTTTASLPLSASSAGVPGLVAQSHQQQHPLAQASAAVALTALAGKHLFT